jgi:hypothetical protein
MPLAGDALARAPLAGDTVLSVTTPGQQPAPDVPGGGGMFRWTALPYAGPLASNVLAGGPLFPSFPGGGLTLVPDPEAGVMRVFVWWPNATALQVLRITPDGARTPVRGGYPLVVTGTTRTNRSTNPDIVSTAGYSAGTGSPALTTMDRTDSVGGQALRATVAAAGTDEVVLAGNFGRSSTVTIAFDLQLSAKPTGVSVTVAWVNAQGVALTPSVVALTADQYTASVDQFYRHVLAITPPVGASSSTSVRITATGMPAGGWLAIDRITLDDQATDGSYFDGATAGAAWTGTAGLSTSVLAPEQTLVDGECPLDVPVAYLVANPGLAGGGFISTPAVLDSGDRTWLTHPSRSDAPFQVTLSGAAPALDRDLQQGVFYVLDRPRPIVRSAATRQAPTGTLEFGALDEDSRALLDEALEDLQPLLLRVPAGYNPGDMWVALGALTVDPQGRKPWQVTRIYRLPFHEVDAPDPALVA